MVRGRELRPTQLRDKPGHLSVEHRNDVRSRLLDWYTKNKRPLPWRETRDPYKIWLSEIMLQQTRVDTVIPYYLKFLASFPTVRALAEADIDSVLTHWAGLGYYRRARHLHAGAQFIVERGSFPDTVKELREVPGIGRYTAGAIASIAFEAHEPLVDGNVQRVFSRLFRIEGDLSKGAAHEVVWSYANELVPDHRPGDFNQAVMELGATVCSPELPLCGACPVAHRCEARLHDAISLYPEATKKGKVTPWHRVAPVFLKGDKILLGKRKETGVFAGLWEPPQWDRGTPEMKHLKGRSLGSVDHILTHRRIRVELIESPLDPRSLPSDDYTSMKLFAPSEISSIAMSTLAKKIVARLGKGKAKETPPATKAVARTKKGVRR